MHTNTVHTFIERCSLLNAVIPLYYSIAGAWLLIAIGWYIHVYRIHKPRSQQIQKIMTILPVIKIFEMLIQGLLYNDCPWVSVQDSSEKYLEMARISIVTVSHTMLLSLFFIIAKGWNTVMFNLTRNQAT